MSNFTCFPVKNREKCTEREKVKTAGKKFEKMLDFRGAGQYTIGVCRIGGKNMLSELHSAHKVIGVKQTKKAIKDGKASMVYVALDAEKRVTGPIYELCTENHVQMVEITTMAELGDAVGIDVGASVVSVLAE